MKSKLLSGAVIPAAVAAAGLAVLGQGAATAQTANPAAAKQAGAPVQIAQCGPCGARPSPAKGNPCAAKSPCNPCAAKSPCGPCAAKNPCGPSAAATANPCAAAVGLSAKCVVPRLRAAAANPCAAKSPRGLDAGKNPCGPCGAKVVKAAGNNPCNPCAAKNPCGPCRANPCAAKRNPCAAANPCAAKNPCGPAAAENPCGAANPCNPCGAAAAPELTRAEAIALDKCLRPEMKAAYAKSGIKYAEAYTGWKIYNKQPYVSGTHGGRYVNNYANAEARGYGRYEKAGTMPRAAVLAKNSFTVDKQGRAGVGPLFLMEKMRRGFSKASHDWRYTLIMPTGAVVGTTNGRGSKNVAFCIECHVSVAEDQDSMMFLPEEARITR